MDFELNKTLIPEERPAIVGAKTLAELLGIKTDLIGDWHRRHKDAFPRCKGKYDLEMSCKFVLGLGVRRGKSKETRERAQLILNMVTIQEEKTDPKFHMPGGKGIEAALERIRETEQHMASKVREVSEDPALFKVALKNWQDTVELLRKTEADALAILEKKKVLVRLDEAVALYNKGISTAQTRLRALPAAVASDLEDQDIITITEILEREIDRALEDISKVWEEEEDE